MREFRFSYVNHRGIQAIRRVDGESVYMWHGANRYHGMTAGWFMRAHCLDRGEPRDFALKSIKRFEDCAALMRDDDLRALEEEASEVDPMESLKDFARKVQEAGGIVT